MTIRVFSSGMGVQSTAALVLAARGLIDYQTFLFANVGEDSEHPDSLRYFREVALPYAKRHSLQLLELQRVRRDGTPETLYQRLTRPESRSIPIPVRMSGNGAPGRRSCTFDFKIAVIDRWLREHGAKECGAQVGLGISLDEIQRMKPNMDPDTPWKENTFPLLCEVEKPLTRSDCLKVISDEGLPPPPKSACVFCPFHTLPRWQEMRQREPANFWYAADLEAFINERRKALGLDPVWFSSKLKPLAQVTTDLEQGKLFEFEDEMCDSGYCMV